MFDFNPDSFRVGSVANSRVDQNDWSNTIIRHIIAKTELLYPQNCGGIDSNVFHIKWIIGTHCNWKNQNPGGHFGATT